MNPAARNLTFAWAALLALLALTVGTAFLSLGPFNTVINFGVAAAKAALVAAVFMHLRGAKPAIRVIAMIILLWLMLLLGLGLTDFLIDHFAGS